MEFLISDGISAYLERMQKLEGQGDVYTRLLIKIQHKN